jgi:hypothetical protein
MVCSVAFLCGVLVITQGSTDAPSDKLAADRSAYNSATAQAGRSADAHVRLALWCEKNGLTSERMKHLALAILYDPSHTLARTLLGLVSYESEWKSPDQVAREVEDDPGRKAKVAEYLERRAKVRDRADDLWKLAMWCEQNGLLQQATAHFYQVLQHDPTRDAAWKHLGYKKISGRWDKPERLAAARAAAELQHKANKHWAPLLEKLRGALASRDKARRSDAEKALASVSDPRAVPSIWSVFVLGGHQPQKIGVTLLGQIDSPGSSRALALVALMSQSADVRRSAIEMLRNRDARDYASVLIAFFRDPIKYDVKAVSGPGSRGELVVKSNSGNVKRLYTPLVAPSLALLPSDSVTYDANGLPVVVRQLGGFESGWMPLGTRDLKAVGGILGLASSGAAPQMATLLKQAGVSSALSHKIGSTAANAAPVLNLGGERGGEIYASALINQQMDIPIGQMMLDAQMSARIAQQQLAGDVQAIDAYNAPILATNERIQQVLTQTTGASLGPDRTSWEKWLVDLSGYAYSAPRSYDEQPTIVEQVPLSYQPQATPVVVNQVVGAAVIQHSCFGAGTPVRTLDGFRPIEKLRAGDQVLTADLKTGALRFQPLLVVYHNPPNSTFRVELDGESIVATGIHRLWKAGTGWVMTRDLKPGDSLRTVGGLAVVKSVEKERVQPVFNLQVAEGESFFVGHAGVLAHDNSMVNPTPIPFDQIPDLNATKTSASDSPGTASSSDSAKRPRRASESKE